jgi:hypothetical protein
VFHVVEISQHALRRYIERVLHLDLNWPLKHGYSDDRVVTWARDTYGLSVHDVNRAIAREVNSLLPDTARMRGSRVVLRGLSCRYIVDDGNCVITVVDGSRKDPRDIAKARNAHDCAGYAP